MLPVPFAKLKDTVASLAKLEQGLDQNKLALSFFVQGTQVSPALSASRPCLYTALIGDAQAQAQKVAAAVGLRVGSIVAMSDQGGSQVLVGAFTSIYLSAYILDPLTSNVPTPNPICSMTVQFKLLR